MRSRIAPSMLAWVALAVTASPGYAAAPSSGMIPMDGSATFHFATSVTTPKGSHAGSGTITIKRSGPREISLTIQSDDGKPARTVALIVGVDGSVAPDPSSAEAAPTDPDAKAQAQAFMAEMTVAAHVGIGARKSGGAASYAVPVSLTPIGTGTPVPTQLTMSGSAAQYTGRTTGQTMTQLPQGGSLDPKEIAKTVGVSAFARHAFTPVGRAATGIVMHRKRKEEKKAASGPLPDTVSLTVTADLADQKIREIRGAQTDEVALPGKPVKIESRWTFTKVPG